MGHIGPALDDDNEIWVQRASTSEIRVANCSLDQVTQQIDGPATDTGHHSVGQMSDEDQMKAGVTPDMIRMSVGIETLDDILWDIDQALTEAAKA